MRNYLLVVAAVIIFFVGFPLLTVNIPSTASSRGVTYITIGHLGTAIAVLAIGSLGLLYRKDRFTGFVVGCLVAALLILLGQAQ